MIVTDTRLKHLQCVVHHKHFGLAAASLGISQPALTKSIQGLETSLGVKLLHRERNGVVLTEFGELVLQHGNDMLRDQSEMLRNIRLLAKLDIGLVRTALGPFPSIVSGYPAAGRLLAAYPRLKLSLQAEEWREVLHQVREESVDFGVAELSTLEPDSHIEFEILGPHAGRLFCHPDHPLASWQHVEFFDALQYPWASTRLPTRIANIFPREPCAAGHIDTVNGDFVPSIQINLPMELGGFAAGKDVLVLASLALVERDLAARALVPLRGLVFPSRYGFMWLKSRSLSPAALAYMAEIRAVEAEFVQRENQLATAYRDLLEPQ